MIDEYREALWEVKDYFYNYSGATPKATQVKEYAKEIERYWKKKHSREQDPVASVYEIVLRVAEIVDGLYGDEPGFVKFHRDDSNKEWTIEVETARLKGIRRLDYRILFDRYNEAGVRSKLKSLQNHKLSIDNHHKLLDAVSTMVEENSDDDISTDTADFLIKVRDTREEHPSNLKWNLERAEAGIDGSIKDAGYLVYQYKVFDAINLMAKALSVRKLTGGIKHPMSTVEFVKIIDEEIKALEDIYVELSYRKIRSML